MDKHDELLKSLFLNKTLDDIEFFDIDLVYASPDIKNYWVVDGGVQMKVDGNYLTFGWSFDDQLFKVYPDKLEVYNKELSFDSLGAKNASSINQFIGCKITGIDAKWNFYREMDENFEPVGDKIFIPIEIILHFGNFGFMQLATVDYEIENEKMIELRYSSEAEMLISINKRIEIKEVE